MGVLEFVLAKVREADLEQFKQKVEKMEKATDDAVHAQGLEHIDDIVKRRGERLLEESSIPLINEAKFNRIVELSDNEKPINEDSVPVDKSGEEIFTKFLQSIRG